MKKNEMVDSQLEINQDLEFQQQEWRVERAAWLVGAVLLVLAVLGVFGRSGPLSHAVVEAKAGTSRLSYQRFARRLAPTLIEWQIVPAAAGTDLVVWVDHRFIERVEITNVTPRPDQTSSSGDRLRWTFTAPDPGQPLIAQIYFEPQAAGLLSGRVGIEGGESLEFDMFVYP